MRNHDQTQRRRHSGDLASRVSHGGLWNMEVERTNENIARHATYYFSWG